MNRISTSQMFQTSIAQLDDLLARQTEAQRQISGGARVTQASQDAAALTRASQLGEQKAQALSYDSNLSTLDTLYTQADGSLGAIGTALQSASTTLTAVRNGSLSPDSLAAFGNSLQQSLQTIASELTRQDSRGQPLYSGGAADGNHPALAVRPGLALGTEIPLSAADQQTLASLGSASWASNLAGASDAQIATAIDQLSTLASNVQRARSAVGARWQSVAGYQNANASLELSIDGARSNLLDPDVAKATTELAQTSAQLTAAQALFSRIQSSSLFSKIG